MRETSRMDRYFARDEQGRELFTAPWARCYRVPDAETGARLRRIVARSPWLIAIAIGAIATPLVIQQRPWYWIFLATPLFVAIDVVPLHRVTRGLERVRLTPPGASGHRELAHSMSAGRLWAFEGLALLGVFFAAPSLARHGQPGLAWGFAAFNAAAALGFAWLLWLRRR